jgi:hypothetical protein
VIKAEFGMSARERILGGRTATEADINWVRRRLERNGEVFFEPWVDRISEIGVQFDIPVDGTPRLVGLTPMQVDGRGQYAGSWFAYANERFQSEEALWEEAIEVATRAANRIQALGYFGPLGIDAMIYRDENGMPQIRPLQDINARWTMGRLSLGWKKLVGHAEEGFWWHGSDASTFPSAGINPTRWVNTSPRTVGSFLCQHQTRLLIQKSANSPV